MASKPLGDDILKGLDPGRRDFFKKIVAGTAFTVPLMASFSMEGLSVNAAESDCCPYIPYAYCSETPYDGPTKFSLQLFWLTGPKIGKKHSKLVVQLLDDGCTLKYDFSKTVDICHTTMTQLFGPGSLTVSSAQVEATLGRALSKLQSHVPSRLATSPAAQALSTLTPSGLGLQFSFPVCFLVSEAGVVLLHHRGLLCTSPGFDVIKLMQAFADGQVIVFFVIKDGIVGGGGL
jgi:hypothetical protein